MESHAADWDPAPLLRESEWIRALALRLVRDAAQADDLVQETLVAAIQRRPGSEQPLRPWLARVLRNRWASARRGEQRGRQRQQAVARSEGLPSSVELLERAEVQRDVIEALTRLREPYRSTLLLRFYEDLDPAEIARRRGVPGSTVRSQIKRGLAQLRDELDRRHLDRRSWSLALVPFAARARESRPPTPFLSSTFGSPAGTVVMKIALVAVVVSFGWSLFQLGSGGTTAPVQPTAVPAAPHASGPVASAGLASGRSPSTARGSLASSSAPAADAAQAEGAILEGTVTDVRSGESLPLFAFDVVRGSVSERIWTDMAGAFRGTRTWAPGRFVLQLIDHPELDGIARTGGQEIAFGQGLAVSLDWDPERAPPELKAVTGPAYQLELSAQDPAMTEALEAGTLELIGSLRAAEGGEHGLLRESWHFRAPVRTEEGFWIRFSTTQGVLPSSRPWLVRVETRDGLIAAESEVPADDRAPSGVQEAVALRLEPRARLEVVLVSEGTLAGPRVALEAPGVRYDLDADGRGVRPDGTRECRFRGGALPAGAYQIAVRCEGFDSPGGEVVLTAGGVIEREIAVDLGPSVSHIAGELRSDSGAFREGMFVRLRDAQGRPVGVLRPKWRELEGRWIAAFRFENIEPGDYRLDLRSGSSNRRWTPASLEVTPPQSHLALVCHDQESVHDVLFQVVDARSGEALVDYAITTELEDCAPSMTETRSSLGKMLASVADSAALEWFAYAPGHAPAWGDRSALVLDGGRLVAQVRLEPGWGGRVCAFSVEPEGTALAPLPEVEVVLDGAVAGHTDAAGVLDLTRTAAPLSIEVRHPVGVFAGGDHDPQTLQLTGAAGIHELRFRL